ncbi:biotin--[acetyl-CoA-carboxylase] ligase [Populibacterium corticicola]|uniref:Biotin--[acetyl-CoA-carboxylase] ligase n=1 Tax=Populibacterium corticicola TaxID=1812826 RepID=A0ABW5XEQ5_9MICO
MPEPHELCLDTAQLFTALAQAGVHLNGMSVAQEIDSTNTTLVREVTKLQANNFFFESDEPDQWAAPALLATVNQTGGRGRTGRSWDTPTGTALTFSLHLEPDVPGEKLSWLPLIVGNAIAQVVRDEIGIEALVKWPNDIVVRSGEPDLEGWLDLRKLGGILVERVGAQSVVIGVGLNITQKSTELPVPSAASLVTLGCEVPEPNRLLAALVHRIIERVTRWEESNGDTNRSGVRNESENLSATLGALVRVDLADGAQITGTAQALGDDGSLTLWAENGNSYTVMVGDVNHLRLR